MTLARDSSTSPLEMGDPTNLVIPVLSAVAEGPTPVAAFDAALRQMGLADLNLIRLSSVIPPASTVVVPMDPPPSLVGRGATWGDRHYVVYADARTDEPGEVAAACVGWVQNDATGKGLFVEIEGDDEERVRHQALVSLDAMVDARGIDVGPASVLSRSIRCESDPVCALVVASYTTEGWG